MQVTNAMDGVTAYVYDKNGNLLSETNTDGGVTRYTYDKLNRVTSITDPEGAVTRVEYDANGNITKVVQADGKSITYSYDARNQLTSYVDPEGYTFSFTYDGNGNITSSTDGNGNTTRYTYDGLDRITQRTDEEGGVATQTFDADGRLIKAVDEEGAETSYVYDACGRVVKMTDALGNSTTYTYDELDRLLTATDAKGGVTTYTYTDRGDVATVTDAEGYVTSYEYDGNQNLVKMTTPDGVTTYEYDPLDRLIKTTTPDGKSEYITYNGEGDVTSKTDKAGHKTSHVLDACGRIVETIDALGNSTLFEYDPMGRLTKTSLHRVDAQDKVDEWEITVYEYDGRGLVTKETNALGAVTAYTYDGNGNLVSKTDADGYVTKYTYNALDFVTQINYNGGKQASYRYNKVGELVEMEDWTGTTSFEVDLLRRITQVTDRKGNVVEYGYDEVGNQVSIDYPDGTGVDYTYDLLHQLKTVTEDDGRTTTYTYDGMGRVVKMEYPHGWVEDYVYDSIGQLLRVNDTDPTQKDMKQQKHVYKYDDCGNMIYEYMRGNGTGEATTENTYAYDALHRVIRVDEVYGKAWREYQYDSLGNLTYERNSNNVHYDYKLNNLNQITQKTYSSNDKEGTRYTYDGRGNLVLEEYGKLNGNGNGNGNGQRSTVGQYTYDETNKMVLGVNSSGESSAYLYNGLGALVEDTWKIAKNGYGYHDVDAGLDDTDTGNGRGGGGSNGQGHGNGNGQGNGNGSGDKPTGSLVTSFSTVVKQFVVDYTSPTFEPLMEHEVNGLDYRYVYGNDRLSVNITGVETSSGNLIENGNQIRLYYHMDYLGTADYLTSPVSLKVTSWTHYNEWGEITHNAVLKTGKRELDLVKRYATHDYDAVLGMYYAKARFYDAENRRFAAVDPVKGEIINPLTMVQYIYVLDNPVIHTDRSGMFVDELQVWIQTQKWAKPEDLRGVEGQEWAWWDDIFWENYQNRIKELPDIQDDLLRTIIYDELVYQEAEKLQKRFAPLHMVRHVANAAIYDTLDPLYTDYQRQDPKSQLVRAFTSGLEAGFKAGVYVGAASLYIDSKYYVDTGRNVWSKDQFTRGIILDDALGNNLGRNFPTVDKINNGVLTSIKSMDMSAKSYQTTAGVFNKINCDLNKLAAFDPSPSGMTWGGFRLTTSMYSSKALELAIPNQVLTRAQVEGLIKALERADDLGILLKIIVVE